jgi:hypothetical protein
MVDGETLILRQGVGFTSENQGARMKKIVALAILLFASLFAIPATPNTHAQVAPGIVCVAPSGAMFCPTTPVIISPASGATSITVNINTVGTQGIGGFDILVRTAIGPQILNPVSVSLTGSIITPVFVCTDINGVLQPGSSPCRTIPPNGLGIVEVGAVNAAPSPTTTTGHLFSITYNIVGVSTGTLIDYQVDPSCTGSSVTGTTTCLFVFGIGTAGSLPETPQTATFVNAAPDFSLSASPNPIPTIVAGSSGTSTITVNSVAGFVGTVTLGSSSSLTTSLSSTTVPVAPGMPGMSTLTVFTTATTAAGPYTVTITGTALIGTSTVTHSITVDVSVIVFTGVIFVHAKLHWTHHLTVSSTGGVQTWTPVVDNLGSSPTSVRITITAPNYGPFSSPVLTAPVGISTLPSFTTPVSGSLIGAKVLFTATLTWGPTGTENPSPVTKSGSFAVV